MEMTELVERTPDAKHCPLCSQMLPLTQFGICRARKDGHNLYCRDCIRKKVSESRRTQKAYKSIREQYATHKVLEPDAQPPDEVENSVDRSEQRQLIRMTPAERVREAIRNGAKTQKEIAQTTKLGKDEIGDALANLLLWTHEIKTEVTDNTRMYFINEIAPEPVFGQEESEPALPRRKRDVPSSFSSLQVLMPGNRREGESEKAGGWVAA
jgi:hypothetical protein